MNLSSGLPYWLIKCGLPYDYPRLEANAKTDVLILGGGISGAITAYYFMNAGIDTMLIDGRTFGLGSTCASTSLLQYEIDTPLTKLKDITGLKNAVDAYRYCVSSIDKLYSIARKIGFKDFQPKLSLYYAAGKKDISFIKEEYMIRKQNGFEVSLLDETILKKEFHINAPAAILSGKAAQTNAYGFTNALHQYNSKKGMRLYDRTPAIQIHHSKQAVSVKTNNEYVIKAKKLVYANGYEAVNYIDKKIIELTSTYAVSSEQMNKKDIPMNDAALMWNTADPYLYLRTTPDNRVIIGGRDEEFYDPRKRDALINTKSKALARDYERLFPGNNFNPEFSWAGTFGSTKDGLPFIGRYKKLPNSYFALGFGGNGITFSEIAAEILASEISGRKSRYRNIFSFERI